jgi:hypothetical protein
MRRPRFDASVSAYREMTALRAEGAATRARVLARAGSAARRRDFWRRTAAPLVIGLTIVLFGAALTAAGFRWRAAAPAVVADATGEAPSGHGRGVSRPTRVVPARRPEDTPPSPDGVAGERRAYQHAHRDHFFGGAPTAALAAWDAYLASYPRGTFAPEARYNRALCLVRLGRFVAAADALRPFATNRAAGYRRHEACLLLRWLAERDARVAAEPRCAAGD